MGAPAVVAGVLAQLQELLDVQVPAFQVGADGALALAALVHGHGRVVDDLQERHHALRFAVGALDVRAQRPHPGPVVAQAAGKLGQQGVFLDRLVDAVQVVGHRGEVAGRQLGAQGAAVEQGRRAGHEVEARQHFVELDGAGFAVDLVQGQTHRHAHEEGLRQLDSGLAHVQEIAVVQGLQAQVVELQVALGLERRAQPLQVVLQQLLVEQFVVHALLDEAGKVVGIALRHFRRRQVAAEHFLEDGVQQQPGGGIGVVGVFLDQRARGQDRGLVDLVHRNAVVEVAHGLGQHRIRLDVGAQVLAGRDDQALEVIEVQRHPLAAVEHMQDRRLGLVVGALLGAFLGASLTVQHVGAGDLVMAAAHQAQFDLVLHVFDMEGAAGRARTHQSPDHCLGELIHRLAHARRSRALRAVHGEERLHHGDRDLVRLERDHRAVAPDDLVMRQGRGRGGARRAAAGTGCRGHACGGGCAQGNLHVSVQHVGAGDLVMAAAHQSQFDLVLDVFDMKGAAGRPRTHQRADHRLGELIHRFAHARRRRALRAMHGEERLHHGDRDLVGLERDHRAIAPDDLVMGKGRGRGGARRAVAGTGSRGHVGGGRCAQGNLHVFSFANLGWKTGADQGRRRGIRVNGVSDAGHYI